jgi:hypothetical protein
MRAMRAVSIIAVLLLIAVSGFALLPAASVSTLPPLASVYQPYALDAVPVLGLIVLITILADRRPKADAKPPVAEAARPLPVPKQANQAEAEIVSFLAALQEKGRLVDFLMDDINAYDDAQVGAAARVVHAGCKAVLDEHFRIRPVREGGEGSRVQVDAGYSADEYRLLGKISGQAPFTGILVHHGWKTDSVKLPTILRASADRLPAIAPAEVELK